MSTTATTPNTTLDTVPASLLRIHLPHEVPYSPPPITAASAPTSPATM